jgi:hypothetical protein
MLASAFCQRRSLTSAKCGASTRGRWQWEHISSAGETIGEIALTFEMDADAVDIGNTLHPHPTLGESIGIAAEVFEGVCTDLPLPRKR